MELKLFSIFLTLTEIIPCTIRNGSDSLDFLSFTLNLLLWVFKDIIGTHYNYLTNPTSVLFTLFTPCQTLKPTLTKFLMTSCQSNNPFLPLINIISPGLDYFMVWTKLLLLVYPVELFFSEYFF